MENPLGISYAVFSPINSASVAKGERDIYPTLGVGNEAHDMSGLEDFELLLVGWEENFAFAAESGVAAAILNEATGYGGGD